MVKDDQASLPHDPRPLETLRIRPDRRRVLDRHHRAVHLVHGTHHLCMHIPIGRTPHRRPCPGKLCIRLHHIQQSGRELAHRKSQSQELRSRKNPDLPSKRQRTLAALPGTAVEGIASGRHYPQPAMHCSWRQYPNECLAWLPGMTVRDIHRQVADGVLQVGKRARKRGDQFFRQGHHDHPG